MSVKILEYPVGFHLGRHHHDDTCIQVVLRGEFHEDGWRDGPVFGSGEALFRPAGFKHANAVTGRVSTGLSLQLDAASTPAPVAERLALAVPVKMRDPRIGILAARVGREMAEADSFSPMAIDAMCAELVVHMLRGCDVGDPSPRLLEEAIEFMRSRVEGPLSVEAVAKAVGADRFRLNRAFEKHKGCSPAEFLRLLRVEQAQRLLRETRDPIVTIALKCGFTDQSHLTKSFRAVVGVSPASFRKQRNVR